MVTAIEPLLREQLLDRRQKLELAAISYRNDDELTRLLREVDSALQRMDDGTYGICDYCHEALETERLIADPLTRLCIDHLSPNEQRVLEDDLELAGRIQSGLLPKPTQKIDGWEIAYHYQPAGIVSGDYCDVISDEAENVLFVLGDVSGKGVAASMLMAHLQAMFRTLISVGLPLEQMIERASRVFCESTLPTHYATLVCGKTNGSGLVEICNAGHLPPLLFHAGKMRQLEATGLPLGIFSNENFSANRVQLDQGDTLLFYTDGFSEAANADGTEYGVERLAGLFTTHHKLSPQALLDACVRDWLSFADGRRTTDDVTLMAIQRTV